MHNKKIKILILTISHIWFDSRLFYKVSKSLLKKSSQIHLITANSKDNEKKDIIPDNFTYEIIPEKISKIKIIPYFIRKALQYKPDIIICIEPLSLIAGYIVKKKLNCRFVYDAHEYFAAAFNEKHRGFGGLYWAFEKYFASKTDSIITVNNLLVNHLQKANQNTFLCANQPNRDLFINESKNLNASKKYDLIYAGSLAFERGLKIYLATAKLFKQNNKDFKLLIIGSFKDKITETFFFDYINFHNLKDYIIYKAYTPHELVLKEIQASKTGIFMGDIQACPRYNQSISMKIFEYMSQCIPVIINKLEMLSDLVNKSDSGWIINYDSQELYNLLTNIIPDKELLDKKAISGYRYMLNNLLWEHQEKELFNAVFGE